LPGKHHPRPVVGSARLLLHRIRLRAALFTRRNRLAVAVAVLVLVGAGSISVSSGGGLGLPLFLVQPPLPVIPVGEVIVSTGPMPGLVPAPPATAGTPGIPTPTVLGTSLSAGTSVTAGPHGSEPVGTTRPALPEKSTATPRPTRSHRPPPVSEGLTAQYTVSGSWDTGFVVGVLVTNPTGTAQAWQVSVSHDPDDGVRVSTFWNAQVNREGSTTVFTGGPVAAGATQSFGFEATKRVDGGVRPTACTVNGESCQVR
jgi:hypothetical protein